MTDKLRKWIATLLEQNEYEKVEGMLTEILKYSPNDKEVQNLLGICRKISGETSSESKEIPANKKDQSANKKAQSIWQDIWIIVFFFLIFPILTLVCFAMFLSIFDIESYMATIIFIICCILYFSITAYYFYEGKNEE